MKLLIEELGKDGASELVQEFNSGEDLHMCEAIRVHLYLHSISTGTLTLELRSAADALLASSETLNIADLYTSGGFTEPYVHGVFTFDFDSPMSKETDYKLALVSSGYTFSESGYVGWVKDFDLRKYTANYAPTAGYQSSFIFEVWDDQNKVRVS